MKPRTKVVKTFDGDFWAYPCTRCANGTMAWEKDWVKGVEQHYLKCVLCGSEVRNFRNKPEISSETGKSEAKSVKNDENNG